MFFEKTAGPGLGVSDCTADMQVMVESVAPSLKTNDTLKWAYSIPWSWVQRVRGHMHTRARHLSLLQAQEEVIVRLSL